MPRSLRERWREYELEVAGHARRVLRKEESARDALGAVLEDTRKFAQRVFRGGTPRNRKAAIHATKEGMEAYNSHRYERAERYFRHAIEDDPDYARAHLYLGNTLYKMRQLSAAVTAWSHAAHCDPDSDAAGQAREKLLTVGKGHGGIIEALRDRLKPDGADAE